MDINTLVYSECQNPLKVKIYNGITNMYEYRNVPCGKCYHCKITKINEWVTRMVIQSNYAKYVYYGTLTYNGKQITTYNDECLSILSTFNKNKALNDTPLILRKDHLQKFFKRLRKNTGVKIQYAACGEYGSTYSRPHFHYIIWSNDPISIYDVYKAWIAPNKKNPSKRSIIGKVEHRDLKHDAWFNEEDKDITHVYKYVCKYIQKSDFVFEKLTNFKQHYRIYEKEFNPIMDSSGNVAYMGERIDDYLKSKGIRDFYDFKKVFSPFFVCSKKPAIGYQYLAENIEHFSSGDFRLFGLSGDYLFPLYFIRKSKEYLCPLKAQSEVNSGATSYSRLPKMEALLSHIQTAFKVGEETEQIVQLFRYKDSIYTLESVERIHDLKELKQLYAREDEQPTRGYLYQFTREYLGLHDIERKVYYSFRGTHYAMYDNKENFIGEASIEDVLLLINYYYERLKKNILQPLMSKSKVSADKKNALIAECGGIDKFNEKKKLCVEQFNRHIENRQKMYYATKSFE